MPFSDITTSLNYSYSNNIWQNDRDHLLAFTLNVPFSHWMRTDSQSAFRNSNASYSMSNDLKGGMTNLSGVYGTLLPDNNLNYSVQVGNTHGGNTSSGTSGYSSLNYRGAYGNTNIGYSRSGDSSQIYYGMSGGIIAHADGITFGQPLGDTMVLVKAPGADNVKIENQTGIHTDWRGYAILPFATEYRENRVALNANSLADNVELDETVVTVIPTHGAIARATFNAQIGGKVLMTLKYGNKSVPFGAIVTHGENKNDGCTVSSDSLNFTVDLQKNSARQFPTTGSTSPAVPFQITLSECSKGTTGVRVAFNGIEDAENNTLLKLDEGSNTASGLGIEILDGNMRPVKLNDLHAGMQWIPLVPEQNNILPYSARLKSTQKSVNPGLVSASATFTLEFQ
ncbi:fimbrial biogenesis outer membrane usher protein [Escherichia coli]|nr:fimbrial outer membrane usher protein FimD [Escherichia coli HVH 53 (4-0631051)]EQT61959.1 fimbrial outer membrane usher protein FimD [Escherichia coli HVH 187 (4-4471660)]SPW67471.1 fimbrial biogenesis outer membrane usher protein [Escherichia coli]STG79253.1 fimbrial biogenesis outer membrane usher protein [Escherichia coli]